MLTQTESNRTPAVETLQRLISFPSVSRVSNRDISDHVSGLLRDRGFIVEETTYVDRNGIEKVNLVGRRDPIAGDAKSIPGGGLAYFAHTDVVPADQWSGPKDGDPFAATLCDDRVYGRGACDMKGSIASMLAAVDRVPAGELQKPIWIVCTADEELGFDGAREIVQHSSAYRGIVDRQPIAIIGEPTELQVVHAHKGITGFEVTCQGRSAHSSTDDGVNANVPLMPILQLVDTFNQTTRRDPALQDARFDPPHLSWNYGIRNAPTAINVTTPQASVWVTLRPMPSIDGQALIDEVKAKATELGLHFDRYVGGGAVWIEPNEPFLRQLAEMTDSVPGVVCYGTDGGEFGELKHRVVLGPGSIQQAHTSDEWISVDQLEKGSQLYADLIRRYCCEPGTR